MFGCWGLLPVVVPCAAFVTARLGALAFPDGGISHRALAGAALFGALVVGAVEVLGLAHLLTQGALLGALAAVTLGLVAFSRRAPRIEGPGTVVTWATGPIVVVALAATGIAGLSAYWLPVWQWDALGYHLPWVNFALVAHGLDGVPTDMPYVSTYPHNIESFILALRAMLPDDRLVDIVQVPFGLLGAAAAAGIARRSGAPRAEALAAGAAWVVVPAVFLQMPTDYVDVGSAAWLLVAIFFLLSASAELAVRRSLLLGALALGLFLGSKPSAPLATAIVLALLVGTGLRARRPGIAVLAAALVVVFGGGGFVLNTVRHGNPVWPVEVTIGPIHLHGISSMQHLLESGAAAPHLRGSLASRLVRSWTAMTAPPVFDMRFGGLGPIFLLALPAAVVTLVRLGRKGTAAWAALAATLATPDPAVARYVLAFPALVMALAAPRFAALPAPAAPWLGLLAGALAVGQLVYAVPGLSGEGPPLFAYARMSDGERVEAVGADGPPTRFIETRARLEPGETFAFDASLELPYLAWDSHLSRRAVWISNDVSPDRVEDFLTRENVRIVVAADTSPVGEWLRRKPERFLKLFPCQSSPCSAYERR